VSDHAVAWLEEQWGDVMSLIASGIPVRGFTWYSLTDQIDWQHALRHEHNDLHPVGLYDLQRQIRPVGEAYRSLIANHQHLLTDTKGPRRMDIVA
jgi:beta-glucosidase